jgi:hypothetical protein
VPDGEPGGDLAVEPAEALPHALADRLQSLKAGGAATGMNADALGRAVVDGNEHRRLALAGHDRGQVRTPHHVDPLGDDRAVVAPGPAGRAWPLMR